MSDTKPSSPTRRNYCAIAEHYEPDGPPTVVVYEDGHGPLVRTSPFGHQGPVLCFTLDRWRQLTCAVDAAVNEHFASRYAKAPL